MLIHSNMIYLTVINRVSEYLPRILHIINMSSNNMSKFFNL